MVLLVGDAFSCLEMPIKGVSATDGSLTLLDVSSSPELIGERGAGSSFPGLPGGSGAARRTCLEAEGASESRTIDADSCVLVDSSSVGNVEGTTASAGMFELSALDCFSEGDPS